MDDVIKLIQATYTTDQYGNQVETITKLNTVFCRVRSVGFNEFYQAAQADLHPEYVFVLSQYRDYNGEKDLYYTDWTGTEKRYTIIRTYRDGDALEITAGERVGDE